MEVLLFVLFSLLGIGIICIGAYSWHMNDMLSGVMVCILGVLILILSIGLFSSYNITKAKVDALVESGKYEIVTHNDYSMNELKQFKNVGGVYLKEIDEEER